MATAQQQQPASKHQTVDQARSLLEQVLAQGGVGDRWKAINTTLFKQVEQIEAVLPPQMKGQSERLIKRAMMTFSKNAEVQKCPPDMFIRCVVQAAEMGLAIDGKLCYVVCYKGQWQAQADYKGLVAVAKRTRQIIDCKADIVCENDGFSYRHVNGADQLEHEPRLNQRGNVIAAYASFVLPGGLHRCCVMDRIELDKIKAAAPAKNGPWASWPEEMQKKCPIRRGLKMFCDDPGIVAALASDGEFEEVERETREPVPMPRSLPSAGVVQGGGTATAEPVAGETTPQPEETKPPEPETKPAATEPDPPNAGTFAERSMLVADCLRDIPLHSDTWMAQLKKLYKKSKLEDLTVADQLKEIDRLRAMFPKE